jgi:hypothetical protein
MTNEKDAAPSQGSGAADSAGTHDATPRGVGGAALSSLVRPPGNPGGEMPGDRHPACQPGALDTQAGLETHGRAGGRRAGAVALYWAV